MKPILQALLVADHVYTDRASNKKVVAGIFHNIRFTPTPVEIKARDESEGSVVIPVPQGGFQAGSPFCYISMVEVRGKQSFTLRYVDLSDDRALFKYAFEIENPNPLTTIELVVPLPPLPAVKVGTYALVPRQT